MKIKLILLPVLLTLLMSCGESVKKINSVFHGVYVQKLYVNEKDGKKKKKLKKEELIELLIDGDTNKIYAQVAMWNKNGLFIKPFKILIDSFPYTEEEILYYHTYSFVSFDTIEFYNFSRIDQINFTKNVGNKMDWNIILGSTALLLALGGLVVIALTPDEAWPYIVSAVGIITTIYSFRRMNRLFILREYPMTEYEFIVTQ